MPVFLPQLSKGAWENTPDTPPLQFWTFISQGPQETMTLGPTTTTSCTVQFEITIINSGDTHL